MDKLGLMKCRWKPPSSKTVYFIKTDKIINPTNPAQDFPFCLFSLASKSLYRRFVPS